MADVDPLAGLPSPAATDPVSARIAAIRARRNRVHPEETFDARWWMIGLLMFILGLADGFAWWFLTFHYV